MLLELFKKGPQSIGKSRGGWTAKIHMVSANDRLGLRFSLSPGQSDDAKNGQILLRGWNHDLPKIPILMDRAYGGSPARRCALEVGFNPVVPPKSKRLAPWEYDKNLYKRRSEIERLFRRIKGFRRIFTRFEKLDIMFSAFIHIALIMNMLN